MNYAELRRMWDDLDAMNKLAERRLMLPDSVNLNIIWAEAGWAGLPYFEWENDEDNPDRFTRCPPDSLVDSQKCWDLHLHIGLGSVGANYYDMPIRLAGSQETVVEDRVVVRRMRAHSGRRPARW